MSEDNKIGKEIDAYDLGVIKEYRNEGKLHPDFLPFTTYDMVQCGYPMPNHGEMISRSYGGIDENGLLIPGNGMWCKVKDAKSYADQQIKDLLESVTEEEIKSAIHAPEGIEFEKWPLKVLQYWGGALAFQNMMLAKVNQELKTKANLKEEDNV